MTSNRADYLGSSDAKDIVSLPPYGCRRAMVLRKAGVPVDDAEKHAEKFDSDEGPVRRGVELEPLIRDRVNSITGYCEEWRATQGWTPEVPDWLRATPDGYVSVDEDGYPRLLKALRVKDSPRLRTLLALDGLLEAKTVERSIFWGIAKTGPRPDHVLQVQHQLCATGQPWCLIAYLNADGWRWLYFLIERDPEWESESYIPAAIQAWAEITRAKSGIQLGASPDEWEAFLPARLEEGSKQCRGCSHKRTGWGPEYFRVMEIPVEGDLPDLSGDPEWESACRDLIEAKDVYDEAEALKKDAEERIKARLGDLHGAQGSGLKVYYKPSTQKRLDTTALKKALPEVAAQFTKEIPIRALRTYQV